MHVVAARYVGDGEGGLEGDITQIVVASVDSKLMIGESDGLSSKRTVLDYLSTFQIKSKNHFFETIPVSQLLDLKATAAAYYQLTKQQFPSETLIKHASQHPRKREEG